MLLQIFREWYIILILQTKRPTRHYWLNGKFRRNRRHWNADSFRGSFKNGRQQNRRVECALLIFLSAFTVCQPFCRIAVEAGAKDQHGLLLLTLKSSPSVPSKSVQTMESKPTGLKDISNFNGNSQTQGKRERFFGKTIF